MKFIDLCALLTALFACTACSPAGNISLKDVGVSTEQIGKETYINLNAVVVMGNLKFPNIEFPMINPTNLHVYGQMALLNLADGTNKIYVSIDYDESMKLDPSLGKTLPNQRELPTSFQIPSTTTMIGIPILEHSRIYLGGDLKKDIYMGAAIATSVFDSALSNIPLSLNIFLGYPFADSVTGYAGLFTGPATGQNGIGIFAKKTMTPEATPSSALKVMTKVSAPSVTNIASTTPPALPIGGAEEISQLNTSTLFKLDRVFKKHRTIVVK